MMDFKTYLKTQELSTATITAYYGYLLDFINFLDKDNTETENCTEKELMLYLGYLQKKGVGNNTRKYRLYALKHYFDYQIQTSKRKDNPAKRIKIASGQRQKLYPILTPQELQGIYENYHVPKEDDPRSNRNWFTAYRLSKERNKVILGLLIHQGITTTETGNINTGDLDLRKGTIDIKGTGTGKDRSLELKPSQIMDIMEYQYKTRNELLRYYENPTQQLFLSVPSAGETHATGNGNLQIFKSLTKELKQQNPKFINFLQVRASVITHWLKNYNLRQVQYFAGHKYISSTEMYLINNTDDLQQEIDSFHPIH